MRNDLGIFNANSKMKSYGRGDFMPALPLSIESQIWVLKNRINAAVGLRTFKFAVGDLYEARLHAVRIGTMRAELRRMKAHS